MDTERKHLVEILVSDEVLKDMIELYDEVIKGTVPIQVEVRPDYLEHIQPSFKAAMIAVMCGCKDHQKRLH